MDNQLTAASPLSDLLLQDLPPEAASPVNPFPRNTQPDNNKPILPAYIDSTMMSAFRSCPRKLYHEFLLGLRPRAVSIHLHAGGCFATALEYFYYGIFNQELTTNEALRNALIAYTKAWGDFPKELDDSRASGAAKTFDRMWEAVDDYIRTYPPHTDLVQPYRSDDGHITTEFSFAIPLDGPEFPRHPVTNEPFLYAGRFDLLGSYLGRPCVRDEKTTAYAGASWSEQWDLRAQFMGYVWACQQSGIPLDTVVVRGVVIQKTQIKQIEAIKIFPQFMVDRWYYQLSRDLHRLVDCWNSNYFDYNFGDACTAYANCIFTSVCRAKEPEIWMQEYQISRWNPLLRVPVEPIDALVNQPSPNTTVSRPSVEKAPS